MKLGDGVHHACVREELLDAVTWAVHGFICIHGKDCLLSCQSRFCDKTDELIYSMFPGRFSELCLTQDNLLLDERRALTDAGSGILRDPVARYDIDHSAAPPYHCYPRKPSLLVAPTVFVPSTPFSHRYGCGSSWLIY